MQEIKNKKGEWDDEIIDTISILAHLSDGDVDDGAVEVTITGGYEDERGDAAKNSMSLLIVSPLLTR